MSMLLETALALFAGLMMTRVFKYLKLNFPDVTAFLIAGVLVGPFVLGRLGIHGVGFTTMEDLESVSPLSNVALGFIAFDIGNEFRLAHLKETGKTATVIGVIQALMATLLVDAVLIMLHFILGPEVLPLPVAITLGAIASATAPAATLMVVRQYKAKGPVTELLLPIVALDDAVGLVVFSVSFGIAQAMAGGTLDFISVIVNPLLEIVFSLILGAIMGTLLTVLEKIFFSNSNRLSLTISFVIMTIAMAVFCGYHEPFIQVDVAAVRALLRAVRRGAGSGRVPLSRNRADRRCLYPDALPRKVLRRSAQQFTHALQ